METTTKTFYANLTHDKGQTMIRIQATSKETAVKIIMAAENCPECAIKITE
jgi:hypothetical protein